MNFAVARLSIDPLDRNAQQLCCQEQVLNPLVGLIPIFFRDFGVASTLKNWCFGTIRVMAMPFKILLD